MDPRPKVAVPFVTTDLVSAEMIKYASNAFLATKISFINEVANLCELVGADVTEVAHGIGLDERIGPRFLSAGIGWGGSCFPKDVAALRAMAREYEHETPLLDATVAVNERQRKQVIAQAPARPPYLEGQAHRSPRALLQAQHRRPQGGPEPRDSPLAGLLGRPRRRLRPRGRQEGRRQEAPLPGKVVFDPYEALSGAHAAVVVTEWEEIRNLDLKRAAALMEKPQCSWMAATHLTLSGPRGGLLYRGFGRG